MPRACVRLGGYCYERYVPDIDMIAISSIDPECTELSPNRQAMETCAVCLRVKIAKAKWRRREILGELRQLAARRLPAEVLL